MKVLIPVGCRSDEGLSAPIIRRMREDPFFEVIVLDLGLFVSHFNSAYYNSEMVIKEIKPDLLIATGDRVEMTAAACAAFHNGIPIAHLYAGVTNNITTLDDINRHCITLWSELAFCEDYTSASNVWHLWKNIKKFTYEQIDKICTKVFMSWGVNLENEELEQFNIYNIGITHLDDLEVDESLVPDEPYDLVLINPTTSINEIPSYITDKKTIVIGSNPDIPFNKGFRDKADYDNLPRPQFLGLLKNCSRFITNSSSAYYEAPYFLKPEQIVLIGERNKNRSTFTNLEVGASDKIVKIVKAWEIRK